MNCDETCTGGRLFKYAERDLAKAATLLYSVKTDLARLDLVLDLQRHLIRCIIRTESRIRRLKRKRKVLAAAAVLRVSRAEAKARQNRISSLRSREQELSQLLFLWRCFGDGIAFVYQSKYSLKHLYYDGRYQPKESAGFMTEHGRLKRGFTTEYRMLLSGIKHDVPVVLSDVTNIIRHGDVCALGGPDPVPLEAKTSKNRNARTDRQAEQLDQLAEFYANDGAQEFRGMPNVQRVELLTDEVNYQAIANDCMATALRSGWCTASPEPGVTYLACTTTLDNAVLARLGFGPSTLCVKLSADLSHLPSYPFTLSLTPTNCLAFMQQRLEVFVFIDLAQVKAAFASRGVHATMLMDGTSALQITKTPENLSLGVFRVSELLFLRIATEFLSVEWFARELSKVLDYKAPPPTAEEAKRLSDLFSRILPTWEGLSDCYLKDDARH